MRSMQLVIKFPRSRSSLELPLEFNWEKDCFMVGSNEGSNLGSFYVYSDCIGDQEVVNP